MKKIISRTPKSHIVLGFAILTFLCFRKFFDEEILYKVFDFLTENSDLKTIEILIIPIFLFASVYRFIAKIIDNNIPTLSSLILSSFILVIYFLAYRFSEEWLFYSLPYVQGIKYADIVIFSLLFWVTIFIKRDKSGVAVSNRPRLVQDTLEEFGEEDLLNRRPIANKISDFICGTSPSNTFSIGVIGEWGSGKSVFIRFMKDKLEENGEIVIDFKPWKFRKNSDLIAAFFLQIEKEISKYSPGLAGSIGSYSELLKDISEEKIVNLFLSFLNFFTKKHETEADVSKEIKEGIKDLNRRIIIVIDDVDRLKPEEIFDVLKIIRSCFDFPNTFFVVAYDTSYLDSGVKVVTKFEHTNRYAEKIFQLEFSLPVYRKSILINQLKIKLLNEIKDEAQKTIITQAINELSTGHSNPLFGTDSNWLESLLETLRDVVRLVNELNIAFNCIPPDEFDISAFILLSVIKVKYPVIYELIRNNIIVQETFGLSTTDFTTRHMEFKEDVFDSSTNGLDKGPETERMKNLLKSLYPQSRPLDRSINNPASHHLYFGYNLFGKISFREFRIAKSQGEPEFKKYINKEVNAGNGNNLAQIFMETSTFAGRGDFEVSIVGELELARKTKLGVTTDLYSKINKIESIAQNYYGWETGDPNSKLEAISEYKKFLIRILVTEAQYPFEQETGMLNGFLSIFVKDTAYIGFMEGMFTKEELQELLLQLFKKRIEDSQNVIDGNLLRLYYQNQDSIDPRTNQIRLNPKAGQILIQFIKSKPSYIGDYIRLLPRPLYGGNVDQGIYTLEPFRLEYFDHSEGFWKFIEDNATNDECAAFLLTKKEEFETSDYGGNKGFKATSEEIRKKGFIFWSNGIVQNS